MIKAVKFVTVPADDQDRALRYYTDQLGFSVATDQAFSGEQRWIELRISGAKTRIVLFNAPPEMDPDHQMTGISFLSQDVRATHRELVARGVEFVQEPTEADWGTAAVFKDPEGNLFVLSSR